MSAEANGQTDRLFPTLSMGMGSSNHFESRQPDNSQYLNKSQRTFEPANASIEGNPNLISTFISIGSTQECESSEDSGHFWYMNNDNGIADTNIGGSYTLSDPFAFHNPPTPAGDPNVAAYSTPSSGSSYSRPSTTATLAMKTPPSGYVQPSANIPPTPALPIPTAHYSTKNVADPFSDQNPFEP